ncbi:MAG: hypothetical protein ACK5N9_03925 [Pirellula sp.]
MPESKVIMLPKKAKNGMIVRPYIWLGGKEGIEVVSIEFVGGGHAWLGKTPILPRLGESMKDISANDLMWDFFQRHARS